MKGKNNLITVLKKHSPTILTCIGAVGVVATTIISVKATPKALELIKSDSKEKHDGDPNAYTKAEAVKSCWFCYIPSIVVGTATIACIFSANMLNKRQQAALTSAYALLSCSYGEYKGKLKELYGEEAHQKIVDSIVKEKCEDVCVYTPNVVGSSTLIPIPPFEESEDSKMLFYDYYSGRYFESTLSRVIQAEYHLNRNFCMRGDSPLNEFYEFLGIECVDGGDIVGWDMASEIQWIDFNHRITMLDKNLKCCIIETIFDPYPLDYE